MLKTNIGNYAKEQTNKKKMWILAGWGDQGRERSCKLKKNVKREREREREREWERKTEKVKNQEN